MKTRFSAGGKETGGGFFLPVILFLILLVLFLNGLGSISNTVREEKLRSMEQAVRRATVQCYAIEGQYPVDIAYLEEHYGLRVDRERYIVHYEAAAANLMPEIDVFETGG